MLGMLKEAELGFSGEDCGCWAREVEGSQEEAALWGMVGRELWEGLGEVKLDIVGSNCWLWVSVWSIDVRTGNSRDR